MAVQTRALGERSLWWLLLSGPVIYSVHFLTVYFLVEVACQVNLLRSDIFGLNAISFWVLLLTVVAALVTASFAVKAWRNWQRVRGERPSRLELSPPLLTFTGIWLNLFFTLTIVLTGLPALFLVVCDWI